MLIWSRFWEYTRDCHLFIGGPLELLGQDCISHLAGSLKDAWLPSASVSLQEQIVSTGNLCKRGYKNFNPLVMYPPLRRHVSLYSEFSIHPARGLRGFRCYDFGNQHGRWFWGWPSHNQWANKGVSWLLANTSMSQYTQRMEISHLFYSMEYSYKTLPNSLNSVLVLVRKFEKKNALLDNKLQLRLGNRNLFCGQ